LQRDTAQEHWRDKLPKWRCEECKFQLGVTDPKKSVLRIKYKDLYVEVFGGSVLVICRRCGKRNLVKFFDGKEVRNAIQHS